MQRKDSSQTQRGKILEKLINARGHRVPLPELISVAAQYNSRVLELRRLGFKIVNEREQVNGQTHTWFRLISGPTIPSNQEFIQPKLKARGVPDCESDSETLFPIEPPDRTYLL
jgi:hypothetical protein